MRLLPGKLIATTLNLCLCAFWSGELPNGPEAQSSGALTRIRLAADYPGADCGAKVNAALIALRGPGEVWISKSCNLFKTQVTATAQNQVLRFVEAAIYDISDSTPGSRYEFYPNGFSGMQIIGTDRAHVILKSTTGVRTVLLSCRGSVQHLTLEGNQIGDVGIDSGGTQVAHCSNSKVDDVQVQNFKEHGFNSGGYTDNFTVVNSWFIGNLDGLLFGPNATGAIVANSHFLRNRSNGLDFGGCSGCVASFNEYLSNGSVRSACDIDKDGVNVYSDDKTGPSSNTVIIGGMTSSNNNNGVRLQVGPGGVLTNDVVINVTSSDNGVCGAGDGININLSKVRAITENIQLIHNAVSKNSRYNIGYFSLENRGSISNIFANANVLSHAGVQDIYSDGNLQVFK